MRSQSLSLALFWLLSAVLTASISATEQVLLFVDPRVVNSSAQSGWKRVVRSPGKDSRNPLMVEDRIWEVRWDNTYPTVHYDKTTKRWLPGNCRQFPLTHLGSLTPTLTIGIECGTTLASPATAKLNRVIQSPIPSLGVDIPPGINSFQGKFRG